MFVGHNNMRNFIKGQNPRKVKINDPVRDFSLLKQVSLFLQFYKLDFFSKFYIKQSKQTCYY